MFPAVIKTKYLRSGRDQTFFCPFVVCIECCWIARFEYNWDNETGEHRLRSCCVCPAIPAKDVAPDGTLCRRPDDDVSTYLWDSDSVSLTDMLLMSCDASPPPGFLMLVQYVVATLPSVICTQYPWSSFNSSSTISRPWMSRKLVSLLTDVRQWCCSLDWKVQFTRYICTHAVLPAVCTCISLLSLLVQVFCNLNWQYSATVKSGL